MALPISLHDTPHESDYYDESDPWYYYGWTRDELYRLNIDTTNGDISVLPSIVSESSDSETNYSWGVSADRSVMIGDEVYYLHKDEIMTTADVVIP